MLEPSASRFWLAAIQSGLTNAQALQICWDAIPPEKRVIEHIDRRLARQAVQHGALSLWQAQQLIAGRTTGYKIDRYVLIDLLGQGGMGRVYLALDTRLNRQVAIKILSPERINNPRAIKRFHREALVGAQLQHENLVRIYDEGEANGRCYLVMEYIEGRNIGQIITELGVLPPATAARLARQVALGLEHAQRKGLIHRDVNPYNILVSSDGVAKLTDLGLAIDLAGTDRVTRDGATVGTFDYVSPEQARHSHNVDARSDIYSLGCTLYHMLAGRVPFPTASLPEKLFGHQAKDPEPIQRLSPNVPEALVAVVARMMRKSPDDRYATSEEVALALEPFIDGAGAIPSEPGLASAQPFTPPTAPTAVTKVAAAGGDAEARAVAPHRGVASGSVTPTTPESSAPLLEGVGAPWPSAPLVPVPPPSPPPLPPPPAVALKPAAAKPAAATPERRPAASTTSPAPVSAPLPAASSNDDAIFGPGLVVNLGPEPSLIESTTLGRSRSSKAKKKSSTSWQGLPSIANGEAPGSRFGRLWGRPWLLPIVAVAGVASALALGAIAFQGAGELLGKGATPLSKNAPKLVGPGPSQVKPAGKKSSAAPLGENTGILVVSGVGKSYQSSLPEAIRLAIGQRGHVELSNQRPIRIDGKDAAAYSGGNLVIRAADGSRPVLRVEISGGKPFLATKLSNAIQIEGVTFEVSYQNASPSPTPLINAGGNVVLDRCHFRMENPLAGSLALSVEGGTLSATGCFFENFDRAVALSCFGDPTSSLRHCMIIRPGTDGGEARSDSTEFGSAGWAIQLKRMPGEFGGKGPTLVLDHCTVQGGGLLELSGFSVASPVTVELTGCAARAQTLLGWSGDANLATIPPTRDALKWTGRSNLYDIQGADWVWLGSGKGTPPRPMPDGPRSRDAFRSSVGSEIDPEAPPLRFATEGPDRTSRPSPSDFAVINAGGPAVGADPAYTGPGAKSRGLTVDKSRHPAKSKPAS